MKALSPNTNLFHFWLLILRFVGGGAMLTHGYPKLEKLWEGGNIKFADPIGLGPEVSLWLVVIAEFACSILLILGIKTRFVVIPLIITMLVAVFITHASDPFSKQELGTLYLVLYGTLFFTDGGKFTLVELIKRFSK
ncbi:MAG: DoxX family protein [Flavobacteriales bacterium]|nr:DoxX family protein [Bacteroidota bacterium]MCB9241560.1 DoxX family protein [Flavobacteriales bacterium]